LNEALPEIDLVRRFVVEDQAVRGQFVRLDAAWSSLLEHADYPEPVRMLLGEAMTAAVLLASTLKFEGSLTLQIKSEGAVRLLVAQCTHDGDSLSESLEHYFSRSEQRPTCVRLAASDRGASGMLIQRLPQEGGQATADRSQGTWEQAHAALLGLDREALQHAPLTSLLQHCFTGQDVRVFAGAAVVFKCRCDTQRVAGILRSLGEAEIRDILAEQGSVTVTCEFCQRPYRFDGIDVEQLFAAGAVPGSERVN
jgi:molecular chaperone Hsp33